MRWEQITSEWNKDFLGCQDLSYQSEEVGFLLATGSFKNPFAWGSVKTACRTKTLSSCCIEFLFAPFSHSLLETLPGLRRVYRGSIRNHFFWGGSVLWCKMLRFYSQNTKGNGVFSVNFTSGLLGGILHVNLWMFLLAIVLPQWKTPPFPHVNFFFN